MGLIQETGGAFTAKSVNDLNTVLGGATGAPIGTGGILLATSLSSLIQTITIPLTLANLQTTNSIPVPILAAQGAGTLIQVLDWTFDLIYGSAAFTGGGAVGLYLGTGSTGVLVSTAVAATFFTTFTASHIIYNSGSGMAVAASTTVLNEGLVMANPTADFASGTGASGIVTVTYRVIGGFQ